MRPQENTDYVLIGTASLFQPDKTIASGPLLVTGKGLYYANYHTADPYAGTRKATNIKDAVADVKEAAADVKAGFAELKTLGEARDRMKQIVAEAASLDQLNASLDEWANNDSRLLRVPKESIESVKTGFLAGLQLRLRDGTVHKFRCGKLKTIATLLA